MRSCNAVILAGGFGTRLSAITGNKPKPLVSLAGMTLLEHQLCLCAENDYRQVLILTHHGHDQIVKAIGSGSQYGLNVTYSYEENPRGTGGALLDVLDHLSDHFVVLYADTYAKVDLQAMAKFHFNTAADVTIFLHPNEHPEDSDLVEVGDNGNVKAFHVYPHPEEHGLRNLVNAAMYICRRSSLTDMHINLKQFDIAKTVFPEMLKRKKHIQGYVSCEFIKDVGTPERLTNVESQISAGVPKKLSAKSLRNAVFLDRDGTINAEVGHLSKPQQLKLLPGAGKAISRLNQAGVLAVCITNQPVVARGELSFSGLAQVHSRLDSLLAQHHAYLDRLYFCPHHPHRSFKGERPELKFDCDCRKPRPGMIFKAIEDLSINARTSWLIGDQPRDVVAGRRAGVLTILLSGSSEYNALENSVQADFTTPDITKAINWVLDGYPIVRLWIIDNFSILRFAGCIHVDGDLGCRSLLIDSLKLEFERNGIVSPVLSTINQANYDTVHDIINPQTDKLIDKCYNVVIEIKMKWKMNIRIIKTIKRSAL